MGDGPQLISARAPYAGGEMVFKYVAYYDVKTDTWNKYDPFNLKDEKGDIIPRHDVIGFMPGIPAYLG